MHKLMFTPTLFLKLKKMLLIQKAEISTPQRKRLSCLVLQTKYPLYGLTVQSQGFLPVSKINLCAQDMFYQKIISAKTP